MRRESLAALAITSALVLGAGVAHADTELFTTYDDFAGNAATGWQGFQNVNTGNGVTASAVGDTDGAILDGVGNFDNTTTSPTVGTNYGGTPSSPDPANPTSGGVGALTINFPGGFQAYTASEESPTSHVNTAFFNALSSTGTLKGTLAIDFTSSLGGTTLSTTAGDYFEIEGLFNDSNGYEQTGYDAPANGTTPNPAGNSSNLDVGGYVVNNGSYFTAYLPYSLKAPPAGDAYGYFQPGFVLNSSSDLAGTVTVDNIRVISVPEPMTLSFGAVPLVGLLLRRRRA